MKKMKKILISLVSISIIYLIFTILYSYFFGLPPFNHGIVVGFPTIFYRFATSNSEFQYGFMRFDNVIYNILIILFLFIIFKVIKKNFKKNKSKSLDIPKKEF